MSRYLKFRIVLVILSLGLPALSWGQAPPSQNPPAPPPGAATSNPMPSGMQMTNIPYFTLRDGMNSTLLPGPRLKPDANGVVWVPAYTDLKLHDITSGPNDPNAEPLDQNQPIGSPAFFAGNTKFITRKLRGVGNSGLYFHHGKFTIMREAILAQFGKALASRQAFDGLSP